MVYTYDYDGLLIELLVSDSYLEYDTPDFK